jgi:hypothetical protein
VIAESRERSPPSYPLHPAFDCPFATEPVDRSQWLKGRLGQCLDFVLIARWKQE